MSPTTYDGSPPSQSHLFPTPPSTAGFSSHMPQSDMNNYSSTPTQNTPTSANRDTMDQGDTPMTDAPDYRRSDHERPQPHRTPSAPYPLPLLCRIPHPITQPHPSHDLVSLYGLDALAATVARRDPVTGDKINKLRKSYEGKVKTLGLPGKNKPTDRPLELMAFMGWTDEIWQEQHVEGRQLERADSAPIMDKLALAMQMNPGKLPAAEHEKWKSLLALDDTAAVKTPLSAPTKNHAQHAMFKSSQPSSSMRASAPASPRSQHGVRPDRPNKRRRYDESSYDGYQDDDGYSTGGLDDKRTSATKKRRKDFSPAFEGTGSHFNNSVLGLGVKSS